MTIPWFVITSSLTENKPNYPILSRNHKLPKILTYPKRMMCVKFHSATMVGQVLHFKFWSYEYNMMTRSWFWFISSQSINLSLVGIRFPDLQSNSRSNSFGTITDCTGSQLMVNPKNIQPDLVMLRLDRRIFGPVIVPDPCQYQTVTSSSRCVKFGVLQLGSEFRLWILVHHSVWGSSTFKVPKEETLEQWSIYVPPHE
jgi:hypothetical protein